MSGQTPPRRPRRRNRPKVVRVEVHVVADPVQEAQSHEPPADDALPPPPAPEPEPEPVVELEHQLLADVERRHIDRRTRELRELEAKLHERTEAVSREEERVERRSAELEAAFAVREDRIEQREAELADLAERLARKERELATYVAQIQSRLAAGV